MIFHFHHANHIRIHRGNRGNDLVPLAGKFRCRIGAAAVHPADRAANLAARIQCDKVVQHIRAHNFHRAAHSWRGGRTGIDPCEINCPNGLNFVHTVPVTDHTSQAGNGIALTQSIACAEISNRNGILCGSAVIKLDAAAVVEVQHRNSSRARGHHIGRNTQTRPNGKLHFSIASPGASCHWQPGSVE